MQKIEKVQVSTSNLNSDISVRTFCADDNEESGNIHNLQVIQKIFG